MNPLAVRVYIEPLQALGIPRAAGLTILRGQLTVIRRRAESGVPVSVEAIVRAEELARKLELLEVAA